MDKVNKRLDKIEEILYLNNNLYEEAIKNKCSKCIHKDKNTSMCAYPVECRYFENK